VDPVDPAAVAQRHGLGHELLADAKRPRRFVPRAARGCRLSGGSGSGGTGRRSGSRRGRGEEAYLRAVEGSSSRSAGTRKSTRRARHSDASGRGGDGMSGDDTVRRRPSQMSRRTARCVGSGGEERWSLEARWAFKVLAGRAVDGLPAPVVVGGPMPLTIC
jgi:hypothetical protein